MSRWIVNGLRTGKRTTSFPLSAVPGEEQASSAIHLRWEELNAAQALEAGSLCPTGAITTTGTEGSGELTFDAGACILCNRCVRAFPDAFIPIDDPRAAVKKREQLRTTVNWKDGEGLTPSLRPDVVGMVQDRALRIFRHSLHIRHIDVGSCNGCESELQMLSSPYVDLQRLGFFFTPTPRHADLLLVTGVVTSNMEKVLMATYAAMPGPKMVIAAGACTISGGSFAGGPMTRGPLDELLTVDAYIPGCPPTPQAFLHGLLLALGRVAERHGVSLEED